MKIKTLLIPPVAVLLTLIFAQAAIAQPARLINPDLVIEGAVLDPVIYDENIDFTAVLNDEGNVDIEWSAYDHDEDFTYYKIVRSQDNNNPVYPKDGYVFFTEDVEELSWIDEDVPDGVSWYRICQIAEPKRYCSVNVAKIAKNVTLKAGLITDKTALSNMNISKFQLEKTGDVAPVTDAGNKLAGDGQTDSGSGVAADTAGANKRKASDIESFFSEYWVQFIALVVSFFGVGLAVTGFTVAGSKKKKSVSKFLHQIDDTFAAFKWKSKRCEAELYRLHDLVDEQLKAGKVDEGTYQLLMNRIDRYLAEIKEIDNLPPHLKEKP